MVLLDLDALEAIISTVCPQCTHCREFPTLETVRPGAHKYDEELSLIQTLAALCLTSKQLAGLATRHLYHRPTCRQWALLARTLTERPVLAAHVRHLANNPWIFLPPRGSSDHRPVLKRDVTDY